MKKIIMLVFLVSSLMGCSIALSPALYGPPYYTGPGYYPYYYPAPVVAAPPLIVIEPAPVVLGPIIIAPSWYPYYYGYGGGYSYPYHRHHRHHHYRR